MPSCKPNTEPPHFELTPGRTRFLIFALLTASIAFPSIQYHIAQRAICSPSLSQRTGTVPLAWLAIFEAAFFFVLSGVAIWFIRARRDLKKAEQVQGHLAALVESSDDAIISKDTNGVVMTWNEGAERVFGYSAAEAVGKPISDLIIPPERLSEEQTILTRIRRGERIAHFETVRVRKGGERIAISLSVSPVKDSAGRIIAASKIARDITEQKKIEAALRRSMEFDEAVMKHMGEGLYTLDGAGRLTFMNPTAQRLLGWSQQELQGRNMHDATHYKRRNGTAYPAEECPGFQMLREGGALIGHEDFFIRKDGSFFEVVYSSSPIWEGGRITGVVVVFSDITERKESEEALREIAENLRRSNEDLEQFAYVASHDLQEPLRSISNYVDLLTLRQKEKLDPDGMKYLEFIQDSADHAQELINGLLGYARITNKQSPPEPVRLESVLTRVLANLKAPVEENNAAVTFDPLPQLKINELQLTQVFQNLISNAIKYRGKESPKIHISAKLENQKWIFSIQDNGIGIDPRYQDRIFMIFKRLHTKEQYPGTGIGLAICKKIIENNGGEIWVSSVPEKGSTFYFSLPQEIGSYELVCK